MFTITREKNYGVFSGRLTQDTFAKLSALPGRKRWRDRQCVFELVASNVEHLLKEFPDAEWTGGAEDAVAAVKAIRDEGAAIVAAKRETDLPDEAYRFNFKTKPFAHQAKAFFLSRDKSRFAYFMQMGTGKSKVVLDNAAYLYAEGKIDTLLLVSPNGVHRQWITQQVPSHLPDWIPSAGLVYSSHQTKTWEKASEGLFAVKDKLRIWSMHIDAFSTPKGVKYAERVLSSGKTLWVIDESTRIKTPGAARTKAILKLRTLAPYRRILSGAPITKGVEDLYPQFAFLDPNILGYSSYYTFRNHFCVLQQIPRAPVGAMKIIGYKNLDELRGLVDGHSFRVTKDECLDLPEKVYMTREVPLTEEQKRLYADMRDNMLAQLDSGEVVSTPLAITQLLRLQQIVCGHLTVGEEGQATETLHIPNLRVQTCLDVLEEAQGQVIIWSRFRYDIEMLAQAMRKAGITFVEYHGGIDDDTRAKNIAEFKAGRAVVFLANQQSGGTGLDLPQASTAIYYSNSFDADARWQSEDRMHRIGQRNTCTYIDLVSPGTVDVKILKSLRNKENVAKSVLEIRALLSEIDPL